MTPKKPIHFWMMHFSSFRVNLVDENFKSRELYILNSLNSQELEFSHLKLCSTQNSWNLSIGMYISTKTI